MPTITVHTAAPYDILIGQGLLQSAGARIRALRPKAKAAVITDDRVDGLYGAALIRSLESAGIEAVKFAFPNGEGSKNLSTMQDIYRFLNESGITRSDLLIALGGGVVGDVAGFAAASWLRGIDFVQIPTTFLAMIDSSVGGKTGVDTAEGKNLIGAFWQPALVLCDSATLSTLPQENFCDGVAEAIKYGAIFDEALFDLLASGAVKEHLEQVICRCVDLKRETVERDERDTGLRQLLNFGHTLGHAIERQSGYAVSHGRAVGIGMAEITRRSEALGLTAPGSAAKIKRALAAYGMADRYDGNLCDLVPAMLGDKKRHGAILTFILLDKIGRARLHPVPVSEIGPFIGA